MATCPKCFTRYPDEVVSCEVDGEALVPDTTIAAMDRDVAPGEMIGEYRVESKIGEGGFGAVYRAVQPLIGKQVAIKVLSRKLSSDPQMVSRFVAEARAVNQIRSKHIVDIFGFGALPDGRQYFVMELLGGVTLEDYARQKGRLAPEEAVPIMRGVARALDAAHAAGIVHRDLKPENVFLVSDEERRVIPKLLDFGIAKLMGNTMGGHKTRTGVPMGTPYYMSPEQCRGDHGVDHRTDIYSFGILAYQILTGVLPFAGDSFMQVMFQHVSSPPPKPSATGAVPAALDGSILHMLEKSPAARPESCGAAVEAIASAAASAGYSVGTLTLGTPLSVTGGGTGQLGTARTEVSSTLSAAETLPAAHQSRAVRFGAAAIALVLLVGVGLLLARQMSSRSTATTAPSATPSVEPSATKAVTASAEPATSATAPAPTDVKLTIQSEPKRVEVYLGDRKLGVSPDDEIRLERGDAEVELVVKAEGYVSSKIKVRPSADAVVSTKLAKKEKAAGPKKSEVEW